MNEPEKMWADVVLKAQERYRRTGVRENLHLSRDEERILRELEERAMAQRRAAGEIRTSLRISAVQVGEKNGRPVWADIVRRPLD